jgi:hypothetical protein
MDGSRSRSNLSPPWPVAALTEVVSVTGHPTISLELRRYFRNKSFHNPLIISENPGGEKQSRQGAQNSGPIDPRPFPPVPGVTPRMPSVPAFNVRSGRKWQLVRFPRWHACPSPVPSGIREESRTKPSCVFLIRMPQSVPLFVPYNVPLDREGERSVGLTDQVTLDG